MQYCMEMSYQSCVTCLAWRIWNALNFQEADSNLAQFTALKSFFKGQHYDMELQPVQFSMPAAFNSHPSSGDTLGSLLSFCVHECLFTSAPFPFWQLSSLTSNTFYDCRLSQKIG
ncbi:TPA: hypothetical protein ACH3X1_002601 [Trebouxia sp. C0004]